VDNLPIKRLTQDLLASISEQASTSSRQRLNYNFHEHHERVQRFLNVLQPGTYVRPHRHLRAPDVNGFEFFLVLQGAIGMLVLDAEGNVLYTERVAANGNTRAIELAEATYHTLVALEPNTVMLELKEGPYNPKTDKDFLKQFPSEGEEGTQQWIEKWESCFESSGS
jgi:cupin fold WbuC family metalloprotein